MNCIVLQNLNATILFPALLLAISFSILLAVVLMKTKRKDNISIKLNELYRKIKEDIKFTIAPKFIELSPTANDLIDLAVEVWRIEQRIAKSSSFLPDNQLKGLENSTQKIRRYLEKYDIEIIDYKNIKYNDGINLDILSIEKDSSLPESMVKETIEPTIMCKGQVVRKAKIILLKNN